VGGVGSVGTKNVKRALDIVGSGVGLILFAPLLAILCVLVRWQIGAPVLFVQQRPGLRGKPFCMIKFRTMSNAVGPDGQLLPDRERLTRIGQMLRSTSLDELPEFWNVLTGDMSLVGPRPLLMDYLPLYTPEQARRHDVRPGITGWAQVNGRNQLGWEEKFALDTWYVDHRTLWLDLRIIFKSIWKVLDGAGVSADGEATMPRFKGTEL
jgi:lipopolysaccharide/colanic/teichoic acid biosynthesis glycosyltransferase